MFQSHHPNIKGFDRRKRYQVVQKNPMTNPMVYGNVTNHIVKKKRHSSDTMVDILRQKYDGWTVGQKVLLLLLLYSSAPAKYHASPSSGNNAATKRGRK